MSDHDDHDLDRSEHIWASTGVRCTICTGHRASPHVDRRCPSSGADEVKLHAAASRLEERLRVHDEYDLFTTDPARDRAHLERIEERLEELEAE